ncbi:MAG: Gfo/Idh/MocA family oxidoreductase [Chloroflexi bacterium]|nr:Gfo/Idh/MocA family oxidoreductase [Chloroflexota bacterium]
MDDPRLSTEPPIRLGLIGAGLAARKLHWPALTRLRERFTVVGVASRTRATAEAFAAFAGLSMDGYHADYQDLLRRDDVEAVLVAVPIAQLLGITRDALAAGKHVLCEKPPGGDADEGRQFVELVDRHPRQVVLMGEQVFYRDEARLARALVDAGAIGAPRLLVQRWLNQLVPTPGNFSSTPWRYQQPAYRGGPLLDGGVHGIAAMRLLGGDFSGINARTDWVNSTMEAPSALAMTFALSSGAIGESAWGFFGGPVPEPINETRLVGDGGGLILRQSRVTHTGADGRTTEHHVDGSDGGFYNQWLNFADAVQHGEPIVGTVRQSRANMLVVLAALDAAETGQPSADAAVDTPATGVPLWRPRGAAGLFDGLAVQVRLTPA